MNKVVLKSFGKSVGLNLLARGIGMLPFLIFKNDDLIIWAIALLIIAVLSLITQFFVALNYARNSEKKGVGQGMLLSVGLFFLIGAAICGPMWY